MSIFLGNNNSLSNAYLGSSAVSAIYLGGTQVWNSTTVSIGPDTFFLGGLGGQYTQAQITNRLTDETITYFVSASSNLYISSSTPFSINGYAFNNKTTTTSIKGGSSCTAIGQSAFAGNTGLTSAVFTNVTTLSSYVFSNSTNLVTASFPLLTAIPDYAFNQTGNISGSFPLVTSIGSRAFETSRITNANFPSVVTMGNSAFQSSLLITGSFPLLTAIPEQAFNQSRFISGSFPSATSIGSQAFRATNIITGSFPSVKTIGASAFQLSDLQNASFPALSGSGAIGGSPDFNYVFSDLNSYTGSMTVPSSYLTNNNNGPDGDLVYLTTKPYDWNINYIPADNIFIGGLALVLDRSQLQSKLTGETITYYNEVVFDIFVSSSTSYTINNDAFTSRWLPGESLTSYIDGGRCTSIGDSAFANCYNMTTASFPSVTTVGGNAFNSAGDIAGVLKVNMPALVTVQGNAFGFTPLSSLDAPNLTTIGDSAFIQCKLTDVNFSRVVSVGSSAFNNCRSLQIVRLPLATSIGSGAFQFCSSLSYIKLPSLTGANALGGDPGYTATFFNVAQGGTIYVPAYYQTNNNGGLDGDLNYLKNTKGWSIVWI